MYTSPDFKTLSEKYALESLAIFGGSPAFNEKLFVGRPNVGNTERLMGRIEDLIKRRWLTNRGPYVQEFENQIARISGVKHCITTCNATIALEIAIRATGLTGEVILPSFTFIATAHALEWQGIRPVFCDIDSNNFTLDPSRIKPLITPQTTGIIGVHLWGRACNVEALEAIAHQYRLKLLFDAAHAFGCTYRGQPIGNFGCAEVFSFHATKFINSFEGGAVVTNDDELASKIRLMQNFGFADYDEVIYIGTNGKMSEASAAMGLTSLESLEEFTEVNRRNYLLYREELSDLPGVEPITYDDGEACNYQYIILEVDESITGLTRDHLQKVLWAENVIARRYFYPGCHRMEPYRSSFPNASLTLPQTERLAARVLSLPTGTAIGPEEIQKICRIIRLAVTHGKEVGERLSRALME